MVPYRDLYVYEISVARQFFKKHFIGCWNEGEGSFLFFSRPHDKEVEAFADHRGLQLLSRNFLDYKAWQAGEELRPLKIENLIFSPPWENVVIGKEETLIHIDPAWSSEQATILPPDPVSKPSVRLLRGKGPVRC